MIRAFYIFLLLAFCNSGFSQKEVTWEDLKCDSITDLWVEEIESIFPVPHFKEKTKKLNNVEVKISGFVIPIDAEEGYYVISKNKCKTNYYLCIDGDQVIDIQLVNYVRTSIEMNQEVTISGTLLLNYEDNLQLFYILQDAKIITDK